MKYKKALQMKKKIMTEKEFELFCRHRMKNSSFILGRIKKKDTKENSKEYFAGGHDQSNAD